MVGRTSARGWRAPSRRRHASWWRRADELQSVGRIDLVLRATPPAGGRRALVDAGGPEGRARWSGPTLQRRLAQLDGELARWARDASADPAFVAARRKERDELPQRAAALAAPWSPPASGSYFTNQLIPLRRALPRDPKLAAAMRRLDQQVGAVNLTTRQPPPPAPPERAPPSWATPACAGCHEPAMAFWKKTVHARAWKTLVDGGKTGFPTASAATSPATARWAAPAWATPSSSSDVQCETCHGPGSLHVAAEGLEEPPAVRPTTPQSTCVRCHNEQHSDTFQFEPTCATSLGPGHGAAARDEAGRRPHRARAALPALAKAGLAGATQAAETDTP